MAPNNMSENPVNGPKQLVQEDFSAKQIAQVKFGLLSPQEIQKVAEFQVTTPQLFTQPSRAPARGGCLDPRLGVSEKMSQCQTCGRKLMDCAGHYGYIKLALPVFHIGFLRHTLHILQCTCKTCARVLLSDDECEKQLSRMRSSKLDALAKATLLKKIHEKCKKAKECPHCGAVNGTVKKLSGVPTLKIIHERFKGRNGEDEFEKFQDSCELASELNKDVVTALRTVPTEDMLPDRVLDLFSRISDQDCEVLWIDPEIGRPENLILQSMLVPPVPIRPSVAMESGGGSNEDDLTVKLQAIIDVNVALEVALQNGPQTRTVVERWDVLQLQVAEYINGEMPGVQRQPGSKPMRGLCQRLKGKQGRFRGNLSGKRVDFSARTVISPDPNLGVDEVGVPKRIAMTMTYPEKVSRCNIQKLKERVRNGPDVHPGANLIRSRDDRRTKSLMFADREREAQNLRIGDVVERHMENGDIVLFNRQPSLHRISIMAHRAKIMEWKTFRFNTCVCAPYNADFDGDEMNMHLPQTEEARAEAKQLMGVKKNLTTPRNGEPLVAASQDFISTAYLLTQKDRFFHREAFCQLVSYFSDASEEINLPEPAVFKPVKLWTGKQLFGAILRPNNRSDVYVNCETKEKNYSEGKHFCRNDGWVCWRDSELLSGNVAKKSIGDGSKSGLLYVLLRDSGPDNAALFMNRWSKFCSRFMGGHYGLSIGISDVTPTAELNAIKESILSEGYEKATRNIELYDKGELELRPGCDMLQSLEEILNGILGRLRESAGQEAMKALGWWNSPRIMADCGAKGSPLNISQMMSCVGQQAVGGNRIQNGFVNRTLPHFEYHSLTPSAKGFVANSFYSGLTATEFFMHMMGGREGLVDTAVKTAETGYMARRLMKALEDLSLQYDTSVRNSENAVVQFRYGDDGLNPERMESSARPVDFDRLRTTVSQRQPCFNERALGAIDLRELVDKKLSEPRFQRLLPAAASFLDEIRTYFSSLATLVEEEGNVDNLDARIWTTARITKTQLDILLASSLEKYLLASVEPGEAVGAIGAQSISEPGTQMTLKTFHFSGISSMNVTLGVPRLKEIINSSKTISTPIITAKLVRDDSKVAARIVKASIEKTTLGEISEYIKEVYSAEECYISIKLDMTTIEQVKLDIDAHAVRHAILFGTPGVTRNVALRALKESDVLVKSGRNDKLRIIVPEQIKSNSKPNKFFAMQLVKNALWSVIIRGIPTIGRAVINETETNGKRSYNLLMEGYGLLDVMGCPGIDGLHTTTNHILEVESCLGIEAARVQIKAEIENIMSAYGIGIDKRHLLLLSDVMTFKGEILGITRFGVAKMRESVLMLASFEKTTDHLFDAAVHGRVDDIVGVSECIIMGRPVPVGTGLPKLRWKA